MKKCILFSLLLGLTLLLALPVAAADTPQVLDEAEINELLAPYLEAHRANEKNLGIAFLYTGSGESYYYNGEHSFYSASLYKVPLCMHYAEKVSRGELDWDTELNGRTLELLVSRTLLYSDNDTAGSLVYSDNELLYGKNIFSPYSGYSEEELKNFEDDYQFTPRFMLHTLQTLFYEPERFPRIADYMLDAAPGHFFEATLGERYDIAQKYGQWDGILHTAGIIFTPTPIILVVMCDHLANQEEALAEFAELFSDYALTLDERLAELQNEEEPPVTEESVHAVETKAPQSPDKAAIEAQTQKAAEDAAKTSRRLLLSAIGCFGMAALLLLEAWVLKKKAKKRKKKTGL